MNRINQTLSREMSVEELDLVSGGNAANNEVKEQQIETVMVTGSWGGVNSASTSSLGASVTGNWGGGYGSYLSGSLPGAVGTAARALTNETGQSLEGIGEWGMASGTLIGNKLGPVGKYLGATGAFFWGIGRTMQYIEP